MPIVEYQPGEQFPGVIGRTADESTPAWRGHSACEAGFAERPLRGLGRHGFRPAGVLRQSDRDAELRPAGGWRSAVHEHAHDRAVLAEPLVHRHGPQPSQQRDGRHHRARDGVPRLRRRDAVRERVPVGDAPRARLQHVHGRQVAPDAVERRDGRGPYTRWPLGRGFERFYGFLGGDTSQWYPDLVYDNHQVEPPRTPEEGYHLSEDLVDKAIGFISDSKQVDPDKPFYLHLCFGATHAPHHVPKEWADKYAGKFDDGWDAYRRAGVRAPEGARDRPRGRGAVAPRSGRPRLGRAFQRMRGSSSAG